MSEGLVRASSLMAAGTVASRVTGMVRDIVLVAATGVSVFGDAFTIGNSVPNIVYILVIGGALNAVFLPQLVKHMASDSDGGNAYASRLVSLVVFGLIITTVLAVLLAPWLTGLYIAPSWTPRERQIATLFGYWCLPQILFYGLYTVFSQVLNTRRRFVLPMFAPILNNLVAIAVGVLFVLAVGGAPTAAGVSDGAIALLGVGSTVGVAVQALVLLPALSRVGVQLRLRTDLRGVGLRQTLDLAKWTVFLVLVNQIGFVVIGRLATSAVKITAALGVASAGFTSFTRAYLLFVLPHSVVTVSVVTAMLPGLTALALRNERGQMRKEIGRALRLIGVLVIPVAGVMLAQGPRIGLLLYGYGSATPAEAREVGTIFQAFVVGLVPFTVFYVWTRVFYAYSDTRTPAYVTVGFNIVYLTVAYLLFTMAPAQQKVAALALGNAIAYWLLMIVLWRLAVRRVGELSGQHVLRTYIRVGLATTVAVSVSLVAQAALTPMLTALPLPGRVDDALLLAIVAALGLLGAWWVATKLRVTELIDLQAAVLARVGRRGTA